MSGALLLFLLLLFLLPYNCFSSVSPCLVVVRIDSRCWLQRISPSFPHQKNDEVVIDEFVIQLMRLKGGARGLDLQTVLYENKRIFCRLSAMMRFMEKHVGLMETRLNIHTAEEFSMREISTTVADSWTKRGCRRPLLSARPSLLRSVPWAQWDWFF
ncbi:unnamed protein product [Prorocentrum cordatum]|uniref:Uncharacterized protein n=1 Tax=Prorocentrum cordatum TaxID=2364126 RepID=A0ABN9PEK5_9DINO|nr:unnamed protein product [Polarella glacialis]